MTSPVARRSPAAFSPVENRFRGAIAASLDAFLLCESVRDLRGALIDFRILELNARAEAFLGRARSELTGKLLGDVMPSVRETDLLANFVRVVETGQSWEADVRIEGPVGVRWVTYQAVPVDDGIAITSRDITERKEVEASLLESEARFRQLVESASDGIYRIDPRGVFTYANPIASRLLGFRHGDGGIVGRVYLEFVRRDYQEHGVALYMKQIEERIPVTYWEFPAIATDGREIWIGQNVHIEQRDGRVMSLFAVARDITERKLAELALRESEERHRFLAEHSVDMLSRQSPNGAVLYASPVAETLLGYTPEELIGTSVFEYCHPDDSAVVHEVSARLMQHDGIEAMTYRVRRKDGQYVWFETTSQAVRDPKTGLVSEILSVSRDISERRRMEEELRRAQKMEAVGQLAGGVAHDFNNLLTSIRGFTDVLAQGVAADDPRRNDIGEILKATERAAALTRQLLAFSKRQVLRLEPLNVNAIIDDMTKIVRRLLGETITVETALDSTVWTVRADASQFEQVLLNLALNARDAMPDGGVLRVVTRNTEVLANGGDAVLAPGRYVVIEVSDSGAGMSEETLARAFEPFFTTKDPSGRAGLGLATVYGIITQSGGHISVRSAPGIGTVFTVHLPVAANVERPAAGTGAPAPRSKAGNIILIAEDNEGVRALTVRLLVDAGYTVFEGCDGVDALETLEALNEPVDLLISDVMMPRMNGSELATNFQRMQPGTPVLLMSGYMDEMTVRRSFKEPDAVLAKPFTAEALLTRVRELIGAAR